MQLLMGSLEKYKLYLLDLTFATGNDGPVVDAGEADLHDHYLFLQKPDSLFEKLHFLLSRLTVGSQQCDSIINRVLNEQVRL